ncbi:MAG: secretin and TonB N-terminal domain-containing protein [Firmicutes bacterium]|jgi:type II secretory pathway component GspD/PulD (secretin)|nr:secretin and TonB N-terminal domain-containing protein [Bacillota bacterium]
MRQAKRAVMTLAVILILCFGCPPVVGQTNTPTRVSVDLKGAEISEVFRVLAELADMNIVLDPGVRGTLSIRLQDLSVEEALDLIAYTTGLQYRKAGSTLIVAPPGAVAGEAEKVEVRKFAVRHAPVADIARALALVVDAAKLQPDTRTSSVLVRGTATDMTRVAEVLDMLDVAVEAPPKPAEPPAPERELRIYRLSHSDAATVKGALSLVVPADSVQVDTRTNSVLVMGTPDRLDKVASIIDTLDIPLPSKAVPAAAQAPEALEVVKLRHAPAKSIRDLLGLVIPASKVQVDERTNSVIMLADEATRIRALDLIAKVDVEVEDVVDEGIYPPVPGGIVTTTPVPVVPVEAPPAPVPSKETVEVIKLKYAAPDKTRAALAVVIPGDRISIDERTNSLVVRGLEEEIKQVRGIVALLDVPVMEPAKPAPPAAPSRSLRVFRLANADPAAVRDALALVVPRDAVQVDTRTASLLVMGLPDDLARAEEIVSILDVAVPPKPAPEPSVPVAQERLKTVKLDHAPAKAMRDILRLIVPAEKVQVDERTNSLVVLGTDEMHARVAGLIRALDVEVPKPQEPAVPAPATPSPEPPSSPAMAVRAFRLEHADAASVKGGLGLVIAAQNVQADSRTNSVLVLGSPDELALAEEIVALMDTPVPAKTEPAPAGVKPAAADSELVEVVRLDYAQAKMVRETVAAVVREGKVQVDERTNSLVIAGTKDAIAKAARLVRVLDIPVEQAPAPPPPEPDPETVEIRKLNYAPASKVREALSLIIPVAKVTVDERTNSLILVATATQHAQVQELISRLDVEVQPPQPAPAPAPAPALEQPVLRVVQLAHAPVGKVKEVLVGAVPEAKVTSDERTNSLVIVSTPSIYARAVELVGKLDVPVETPPAPAPAPPARDSEVLRVVKLSHAPAQKVREAVQAAVPSAVVTADERTNSLVIVAPTSKYEQALEIIAELDVAVPEPPPPPAPPAPPAPEPEEARVVKLQHASPGKVREALAPIVPASKVTVDERTGSLVIVATAGVQAKALEIIEQLDVPVAPPPAPAQPAPEPETLNVIRLAHAPAAKVREALAPIVTASKVTVDDRTNSLVVMATASRYAQVMEAVSFLDVPVEEVPKPQALPAEEPVIGTFKVANAPADSLKPAISLVVEASGIQVDTRTNTLLVRAVPSKLERVREIVATLDVPVAPPPEPEPAPAMPPDETKVFKLIHAPASEMKSALSLVLPADKMQADDRTRSLVVVAPAPKLESVQRIIESLDVPSVVQAPRTEEPVTRVYRLNFATPAEVKTGLTGLVAGTITADARTSSIIVSATEPEQRKAMALVEALDRELAQVLIEARLEELTGDAARRLGIDWTFSGIKFGENALGQWTSVSLDFLASLTALEDAGEATLISRQHTFTQDGKTGKILIGDRIPVITETVQDGQVVARVEFINAGIELSITPKVSGEGTITATVKPIISSIVGWTPQNYPQIRTRELETIVSIKNGETVVIGGLLHRDEIQNVVKVPLLGDIPILGEVFKKRTTTSKNTEIVMLITAWVVKPGQRTVVGPAKPDDRYPVIVQPPSEQKSGGLKLP